MSQSDKQFDIPFSGLKIGKHTFDFEIGKSFFEGISYSMVQSGSLNVRLELEKKETMLLASFTVKGEVETECDRCNASLHLPLKGGMKLIYKFGYEPEEDESLVVLHPEEYQINVREPIYEMVMLSLPSRKIHAPGACDEEMVKLLQQYTVNPGEDDEDYEGEDYDEDDYDEEDFDEEDDEDNDNEPDWPLMNNLN